ncbi:hypothetical protein OGAPHI_002929 [Ogataea philodendri]|uniref:Uncharacterized protein n=1 Tax=Ogataea philodendri TaxID=1378263 RepID=A0A9P8T6N5_9ASCO|nr:uncharacterized protein OGAPHI_002929 [Ogataea philodendri]KAH3667280.1 hypothetical protein OGAPHI_002929 [Ogataea philodendri]
MSTEYDVAKSFVLATLKTIVVTTTHYVTQFKDNYPNAWSWLVYLLVLYVTYRLLVGAVRFVYRTIVNIVKLAILIVVVAVAINIWITKPKPADWIPQIQYALVQLYHFSKLLLVYVTGVVRSLDWKSLSQSDFDSFLESLSATRSRLETLWQHLR